MEAILTTYNNWIGSLFFYKLLDNYYGTSEVGNMIDRNKIPAPRIDLAPEAARQLQLMLKHDPTLRGKCVRVHIEGKGCQGFRYAVLAGEALAEDFVVESRGISLHLDPFCAFYLQEGRVDYRVLDSGEDGFTVSNLREEKYRGKFWREREELIPPQLPEEAASSA